MEPKSKAPVIGAVVLACLCLMLFVLAQLDRCTLIEATRGQYGKLYMRLMEMDQAVHSMLKLIEGTDESR
jgi:hypothetical protein